MALADFFNDEGECGSAADQLASHGREL